VNVKERDDIPMKTVEVVLLSLFVATLVSVLPVHAQYKPWVFVTISNGPQHGTDTMGHATGATDCIDASFGESELPPPPPSGVFDTRFVEAGCSPTIQGLSLDMHGWNTLEDTSTTFNMRIQKDTTLPILLTLSRDWTSVFPSLEIYDGPSGGVGTLDIIMATDPERDTLTLGYFATTHGVTSFHDVTAPAIIVAPSPTGVPLKNGSLLPKHFELSQNFPNPFNPTTTISFAIERVAATTLEVYNVLGQRVATLISQQLAPGNYTTRWNGTDDHGAYVSSGVYFLHMSANTVNGAVAYNQVRKIVLMK
jgi:hypothetical protein